MNVAPFDFETVARLPAPSDNVAIATRTLAAGTPIQVGEAVVTASHTVLVGHRFAARAIDAGEPLTSWGQTFGLATRPIQPGEYVCNPDVLAELRRRSLRLDLPATANFKNELAPYHFDEAAFRPAPPLPRFTDARTFLGYRRAGERGVGTRNTIILLATSSLCAGFVRKLEARLKGHAAAYPNIDGIVAIAHTEGGHGRSNNEALVLRTLAGFCTHPNVGAVLIVDYAPDAINNALLRTYLDDHHYPMESVLHQFLSLTDSFEADLSAAESIIQGWLAPVNAVERTPQPVSALKIALQCGGSDAFSGISGNPLAGWVAKAVIQYGGAANLAETDELIGAETYTLDKVRDAATARKFLATVDRFKQRAAWHGSSADGNPTGGNKFRGLYNIYLKSLGAATKRNPDVPLDFVIDYSEPMRAPGFYFMDSPGNDLESIAGQVASGCNMILFVTGNGSITNFPFVPTVKIVTTTDRYNLLAQEMDVNAGRYLDGTPLDTLGAEAFDYTLAIAAGRLSVGEKAGHSQVQIWRDWQLTSPVDLEPLQQPDGSGEPIRISAPDPVTDALPPLTLQVYPNGDRTAAQLVCMVMPTSLCAGQIAQMAVEALNKSPLLDGSPVTRFVSLVHTEGCGSSGNREFRDTLLGYLTHPALHHTLLLEHGCEQTHNDYFRGALRDRGLEPESFGWASIQLDGGIHNVVQKIHDWFAARIQAEARPQPISAGLEALRVAFVTQAQPAPYVTAAVARLTRIIIGGGGTVVIHEHDPLWGTGFTGALGLDQAPYPSLSYAQPVMQPGFHVMAMPTRDWNEMLSGLGAAGVELIAGVTTQPMPGHPLIPVLEFATAPLDSADLILTESTASDPVALLDLMIATLEGRYTPQTVRAGNVNFQITRGLLGVSL
jgi:altronate dehydratase